MTPKIIKLKNQIKALNLKIQQGQVKNIYAVENKIKQLKTQLNELTELFAYENYLSK
jgi:hypothetical protein